MTGLLIQSGGQLRRGFLANAWLIVKVPRTTLSLAQLEVAWFLGIVSGSRHL